LINIVLRNATLPAASNEQYKLNRFRAADACGVQHILTAENLKELYMKLSKISLSLLGAALLFSSAALANDSNKATLKLAEKLTVDGKPLDPGSYSVKWDGAGPTVQVSVIRNNQTVATFSAHVTEQSTRNTQDAYGSAIEADGSHSLTAIYPNGKHFALELEQKEANQHSATSNSK
jgi:hypothetical protein